MAGVQAGRAPIPAFRTQKFQSLSRDGGGSSPIRTGETRMSVWFQSLSRDGGGSSAPPVNSGIDVELFQSLSRDGGGSSYQSSHSPHPSGSFNPSVGMAGVQAFHHGAVVAPVVVSIPQSGWRGFKLASEAVMLAPYWFQSLSRDGGGSSCPGCATATLLLPVSIPQSGWRGFKLRNPSRFTASTSWFQSLSRDGGGSSPRALQ